jgi:hypothetical protein
MIANLFALLPLLAVVSAGPINKRASSRLIESGIRGGQCLSVEGGRAAVAAGTITDGTSVRLLNCGVASFWDISPGSGSVVLSGTNFALDASVPQGNFNGAKVSQVFCTLSKH